MSFFAVQDAYSSHHGDCFAVSLLAMTNHSPLVTEELRQKFLAATGRPSISYRPSSVGLTRIFEMVDAAAGKIAL